MLSGRAQADHLSGRTTRVYVPLASAAAVRATPATPPVGERGDERRADDRAVGVVEDLGDLLGGRDADSDAGAWSVAGGAEAGDERARGGVDVGAGAGDAHGRDRVDEAAARARRSRRAAHRSRGAARNTRSRPVRSLVAIQSAAESGVMSGVISPAPPASTQGVGETVDAVLQHRVPVGHHEHGGVDPRR